MSDDGQLDRADLVGMSAEAVDEARRGGRLADLLAGPPAAVVPDTLPRVEQLSRADLAGLTSDQIDGARRGGRLAEVLGGRAPVDMAQLPPVGAA